MTSSVIIILILVRRYKWKVDIFYALVKGNSFAGEQGVGMEMEFRRCD